MPASTSDPFRLDGRTALITGGTQGVGAAIARSLSRAGADVLLHGREPNDHAYATRDACLAEGVRCELLFQDLAAELPQATDALLTQADQCGFSVDTLVNNAGVYIEGDFLAIDPSCFEKTLRINVAAGFYLTQVLARRWVAGGVAGRVLFTGSINGRLAEQDHVVYDTSKGAVAAMVRSLCVALAPRGIRVNSIAPGLVRTPLTSPVIDQPEFRSWMEQHTPAGIVPNADVCGPGAVFLLSDAAEHIHGQTLYIDGGMSAWQQPDPPPANPPHNG